MACLWINPALAHHKKTKQNKKTKHHQQQKQRQKQKQKQKQTNKQTKTPTLQKGEGEAENRNHCKTKFWLMQDFNVEKQLFQLALSYESSSLRDKTAG